VDVLPEEHRARSRRIISDFCNNHLPTLEKLRCQVIHGDAHPFNTLTHDGALSGIIDFGDMLYGPLVLDISTAAMELAAPDRDPVALIVAFLEGFAGVTPLTRDEVDCVYDGLMTRLAVGTLVYAWRDAFNAEPRFDAGAVAARFIDEMKRMEAIGREAAGARFHAACGTG
jgi:Ser/Thr protein kinase RdoA (MazF antagonist)